MTQQPPALEVVTTAGALVGDFAGLRPHTQAGEAQGVTSMTTQQQANLL